MKEENSALILSSMFMTFNSISSTGASSYRKYGDLEKGIKAIGDDARY